MGCDSNGMFYDFWPYLSCEFREVVFASLNSAKPLTTVVLLAMSKDGIYCSGVSTATWENNWQ